MTPLAMVSTLGACIGLTIAVFGLAFSSAPGWRAQRFMYFMSLACGVYCACDVVATVQAPLLWRERALALSLTAMTVSVGCWWRLASNLFPSPLLTRVTRIVVPAQLGLGLLPLIPGLIVSHELRVREVTWLGVRYFDMLPTALGEAFIYSYGASLAALVVPLVIAARRGSHHARVHCIWIAVMLAGFIVDALAYVGWVNWPYVAALVFLGVVVSMSVLTVRRFIENAKALETLSAELEDRVEQRTHELAAAQAAMSRTEKLAALGTLAAGVAHEINNPAAAVTANLNYLSEGLRDGELPEDAAQCLDESRSSMKRIASIVKQMLDTGRAASSPADDGDDVTDVTLTGSEVLAWIRPRLSESTEVTLAVEEGLQTRGNPMLLDQILRSLLMNSGQAIAAGRGQGHIQVLARSDGPEAVLEVRDDGCGVDEETRKRMFDPFFTTRIVGQGAGLGLSVTAGLVISLGGSLSVESTPGQGTVMRIRLPRPVKDAGGGTLALLKSRKGPSIRLAHAPDSKLG